MTISSETNKSGPFDGNGVTTAFPGGFKISDEAHVQVIATSALGVESTLTLLSDYTVSGVGDDGGFTVNALVAPASGVSITLIPDVPFTQGLDLVNQGAYNAEDVEEAFDLAVQRDLQLLEKINRAVTLPASADVSDLDLLVANINALGAISANVATVAGIAPAVSSVATISANVSTVAGVSADVTAVAAVAGTLAGAAATAAEIAADVILIDADRVTIAADKATVAADKATVAADKGIVAADKALVAADKAATNADVVLTNADVVLTHADVILAEAAKVAAEAAAGGLTAVEVQISAAAAKTTPVDGDLIALVDSAAGNALKKLTFANLFAWVLGKAASAANYRANTNGILGVSNVWAAAAEITLADAATIAVDGSTFINASATLAGNRTLGTWANAKVGQSGYIRVVQDATGSRTLAYHADYEFAGGTAPALSTAAAAQDMLFYQVVASGRILLSAVRAIS